MFNWNVQVEVSTFMKQQKLVDCVRVEHRLFHSSRKCQSQESGSYSVAKANASLENIF